MLVAEPQVLQTLGWNEYFVAQLPMIKETLAQGGSTGAQIARVTGVERTGLSIAPQGELLSNQVPISGRWFRGDESTRPTIGDWVVVDTETGSLVQMLERRSLIQRINPLGALQLIAANVDTALIVSSCNADFSPERLERYLSVVMEAGVSPVLLPKRVGPSRCQCLGALVRHRSNPSAAGFLGRGQIYPGKHLDRR
jgi:ribosome biogenesis GTPase